MCCYAIWAELKNKCYVSGIYANLGVALKEQQLFKGRDRVISSVILDPQNRETFSNLRGILCNFDQTKKSEQKSFISVRLF